MRFHSKPFVLRHCFGFLTLFLIPPAPTGAPPPAERGALEGRVLDDRVPSQIGERPVPGTFETLASSAEVGL